MSGSPDGFRGRWLAGADDLAPFALASGILRGRPHAAAVPADPEDVRALLRWATATRTPIIPRGAGTGMPGGNVGRGIAVDMVTEFRWTRRVDPRRRSLAVGPGATLAEVNQRAAEAALRFPVDPSSGARCTVGGVIANNSGGAHSVRFGATRRWVRAVDIVLADGTRGWLRRGQEPEQAALRAIHARATELAQEARETIECRWPRVRKNSSGYALMEFLRSGDLLDLLVGSEGTLGLVVAAELDLAPLPAARGTALLEFTSLARAGEALPPILVEDPATCELLDRTFLELVRQGGADSAYPLRPGLEAILLVEVEGTDAADVAARLQRVQAAVEGLASRCSLAGSPERERAFWEIRHAASPLIAARAGRRVSMQFIEDGVVPVDRVPAYILALREILDRHRLPAVIFGHAGDGNLHVNPLVDVDAPDWRGTLERVLEEVADRIRELGGTLSGEHGDGRLRAPMLERVWGSELTALFREVKSIFDPAGILNPGVILPLPGQRPFDDLPPFLPP